MARRLPRPFRCTCAAQRRPKSATSKLITVDAGEGSRVATRTISPSPISPKRPLTLVLALPRPPVFRRLLSTIASLGVARLLVVGTARTEKSFWQSHVIDEDQIRERLLLGLEQARDSVLPEVEIHRYFEDLVENVLPPLLEESRGLMAHPGADLECPHALAGQLSIFVGPEGGFTTEELDAAENAGFRKVSLGRLVLRTETAAIAGLTLLAFISGRLES